ncbi:MAG: GTP cyclohydrolase I FolE2 [Selenomonas sp.]|nr:GTP cyclohydrolase I FolE2 [Selenomonas sp.]
MQDVQNRKDKRGIAIQKVGIKEAHLPFLIKTKEGGYQQVLATVRFTVALPSQYKGTHMSRFLEILMPWSKKPLAETEMEAMLSEALERLEAHSAEVELSFKYFVDKVAPVSHRTSVLDLDCCFTGRKEKNKQMEFLLGVEVPFTSLCPCSKEISSYGAHNQRSVARIQLRFKDGYDCIYIEDLAELVEKQGSSPIYPLLKREDEKFVTEAAYENPKFVEDILRDTVLVLRDIEGLGWFSVECENYESIHNHSAYAAHEEEL